MEIRATTTFRNNKMITARERLGLSQIQLAAIAKTTSATIHRLEKMDFPQFFRDEDIVIRIAVALEISPDDVMPDDLRGFSIPNKDVKIKEITTQRLIEFKSRQRRLLVQAPPDEIIQSETRNNIEQMMECLSFREREIVKLRFGLADGGEYTLEEIARIFKVTRERIRIVEATAIKKMNMNYSESEK